MTLLWNIMAQFSFIIVPRWLWLYIINLSWYEFRWICDILWNCHNDYSSVSCTLIIWEIRCLPWVQYVTLCRLLYSRVILFPYLIISIQDLWFDMVIHKYCSNWYYRNYENKWIYGYYVIPLQWLRIEYVIRSMFKVTNIAMMIDPFENCDTKSSQNSHQQYQ